MQGDEEHACGEMSTCMRVEGNMKAVGDDYVGDRHSGGNLFRRPCWWHIKKRRTSNGIVNKFDRILNKICMGQVLTEGTWYTGVFPYVFCWVLYSKIIFVICLKKELNN